MDANDNLIRWTESFMLNRSMSRVIKSHLCEEMTVETKVPQRSPVSLILFAIYLSGVFREVEKKVEGYMTKLFADNCWLLVVADSVE